MHAVIVNGVGEEVKQCAPLLAIAVSSRGGTLHHSTFHCQRSG